MTLGIFQANCTNIRSLYVTNTLHKESQMEQIFNSRCTIGGKVCGLIIDGGTCTTLIDKLLISFSIGLYYSEVLSDVLPMDACHLLLSRPRLFDNHVIYDGHANTYSPNHNRFSHTLTRLPPLKPLIIKPGKGREKRRYKIETQDESATSKSKPQISLLIVKSKQVR